MLYAIGQLGWSLASFGVLNLFTFFYMPPETGEATFPVFIFQGAILGLLTVQGLVTFGGRLFDAITDPFIANLSDRSQAKMGKRKLFLLLGAIPFALFSFLVFLPISDSLTVNTIWVMACIFLFYICFTFYTIPYNALISELGHHPKDRMLISTLISVTWALGFLIGNTIYAVIDGLKESMSATQAFQVALAIYCFIAMLCMLFPVFFLDENKYSQQENTSIPLLESIQSVWGNRNFRFFLLSDLTYWLAITIIQVGMVYYVTLLLKLELAYTTYFLTGAFFISFLYYVPVNMAANRYGKKPVISFGFLVFALAFGLVYSLGNLDLPISVLLTGLAIITAVPMAIFGIVPTAIIADVIHEHAATHKVDQAGMYYAIRSFMMKLGVSLANLIFPSFLLLGRSVENDWGVRVSCLAALAFCLIGFALFQGYKETKVVASNSDS